MAHSHSVWQALSIPLLIRTCWRQRACCLRQVRCMLSMTKIRRLSSARLPWRAVTMMSESAITILETYMRHSANWLRQKRGESHIKGLPVPWQSMESALPESSQKNRPAAQYFTGWSCLTTRRGTVFRRHYTSSVMEALVVEKHTDIWTDHYLPDIDLLDASAAFEGIL